MSIDKIVLIGAGNLATQLGKAFCRSNKNILQVLSRTQESAEKLAGQLGSEAINNPDMLSMHADLYVLVVNDDTIPLLVNSINFRDRLIVHTSGAVGIDVLKNASSRYGVFYPLQTFSKNRDIDFSDIPICVEGCCDEVCKLLITLAGEISEDVRKINTLQRQSVHLAAVFAANFTNHFYHLADEILKDAGISFDIIQPLILETAKKIMTNAPADAQTGPAARGDMKIIEKHLQLLNKDKKKLDIYKTISKMISEGKG
jgi:predicted short-subunit dehydrogenase-like oxidoreductase (DUF2520 family)